MNSLKSFAAVSVILLALMTKVCIIRGLCSNSQTTDCCNTGYFYDSASKKCMKCPDGFTGINCSLKCRYPSYGYRCQSQCDCPEKNCDASTGCILNTQRIPTKNDALSTKDGSLIYASDLETESVSREGSKIINDTKKSPDVAVTPVLIIIVVVLIVILVAIVSRYIWRKCVARRENDENRGDNSEEFLNRKSRHSDETNENMYDELDESKMKAAKDTNDKGPGTVDKTLRNDYIDSLALKKRQSDRESKHFYDSLK